MNRRCSLFLLAIVGLFGSCSLEKPEKRIDVGIAALTLAKEIYPEINVDAYSARIDELADHVHRLAGGSDDPDRRIRCLNTVLFRDEKFQADRESSFRRNPETYYLNRVLDTKQGNCFSMPLLYVAVAQRLGWPIHLVHVPDHSFARYVDPAFREANIETSSGGGYVSDERYAVDFMVSLRGRESGAYLRTLTHRELMGDLAAINAITVGQNGQLPRAVAALETATRLNPRNAGAWANLAVAHRMMSRRSTGSAAKRHRQIAAHCAHVRDELGFVHPREIPLFPTTRRKDL